MLTDATAAPAPAPADRCAHVCQVTDRNGGRATLVVSATPNGTFERSCTSRDFTLGPGLVVLAEPPSRDLVERVDAAFTDGLCVPCRKGEPCEAVQAVAPSLRARGWEVKSITWRPEKARPAPGAPGSVENPVVVPPVAPEYLASTDDKQRLRRAIEVMRDALGDIDKLLSKWL